MNEQSCSPKSLSTAKKNPPKSVSDVGEMDVLDGFGGFYVNVKNADAFLVSMAYSKASIAFICLIGALTAFNTLTFTGQISNTNLLCRFNDYLPVGKDLRKIVIPIVYRVALNILFSMRQQLTRSYWKKLEKKVFGVSTNILQLLFCLAALVCALNRRSSLFLLCYSLLCVTLWFDGSFLLALIVLNYEHLIVQAVEEMLEYVLSYDNSFCQMLEPILECRISRLAPSKALRTSTLGNSSLATVPLSSYDDAIEMVCGVTPRRQTFNSTIISRRLPECNDFLTSFLLHRNWLIALMTEYFLVILAGCYVTVHAIFKRRKRLEKLRRASANNSCSGDAVTRDTLIASSIVPAAKKMSDELVSKETGNAGAPIILVDDMPLTGNSSNNNYYQSI